MPLGDYVCSSPEIPDYAPQPPPENDNCGCSGCGSVPFYTPPNVSQGKPVEILAGTGISVEDLSDINTYRFRINQLIYEALTVNMSAAVPYISGVNALLNGLVLFGRIVDRVDLSWAYNKSIINQTLSSSIPAFDPIELNFDDFDESLTGLSVDVDRSFTITGNDGSLLPGGIQADTEWVRFGNYARWGFGADFILGLASGMQGLFNGLAGSINTNTRNRSFFATGGVNQHCFYFYPARFGEATFTKGIFVGGFIRLKNVDGTLYDTIPDGETEDPITINNGYASEEYYVYQSMYDNQDDPVTPIVVT